MEMMLNIKMGQMLLEQEVNDLVTFLTWTSMPDLEDRRSAGLKVIFFLFIMTIVFYLSYRKIWSELKNNYKENLLLK